jgi:hypothetical protein
MPPPSGGPAGRSAQQRRSPQVLDGLFAICVQTIETTVGRCKAIIGPRLRARGLPAQQGEAAIAVEVLNRMLRVAKPVSVRAA